MGGLYLWVSFLSSRSSRADSMYPDARSRKCSRARPSTSDVTSSSGFENTPSSFQSMHTSHLACIGLSLLDVRAARCRCPALHPR